MTTTYKANPDRIRNLNMNCTSEEGMQIVERFAEQAFTNFKQLDFPYPDFDQQRCINEYSRLVTDREDKDYAQEHQKTKNSGTSSLIKGFHRSLFLANKEGHMSPLNYWNFLKTNFEEFKKFYYNRITRSDWFKKDDRMDTWARKGRVPTRIYLVGLTTSGIAPCVGYFKPKLAKYLIEKYASEFNTIFDPFSGFSGRMLGALASNKEYIGQDINALVVKESNDMLSFLQEHFQLNDNSHSNRSNAIVLNKNTLNSNGKYECLLTCPPYSRKEEYLGNIEYKTCDEWIDECLNRFQCKKYIFVVNNTIQKYREYIKEPIVNTSHWGSNSELVVVIE